MVIAGERIRLREKKLSDARNDYNWSRDVELSELDAAPPLIMGFQQYLLDYSIDFRFHSSTSERFAIETMEGKHIGNCSFYDINESKKQAELGIMIADRDYWGKGYGTDVINTMLRHFFTNTKTERVYLKTLNWNARAQECFKKCGFVQYSEIERDGYRFILMEITRQRWEEMQKGKRPKALQLRENKLIQTKRGGL